MPKISTEKKFIFKGLEEQKLFKYDINVSVDGKFYTTLPQDIVEILEKCGVGLSYSRRRKKGYFESETKEGLIKLIDKVIDELRVKEKISEDLVIRYEIRTQCGYCVDKDNTIKPNGSWVDEDTFQKNNWSHGTAGIELSWSKGSPYGFLIYAEAFYKRVYKYKSGREQTEYDEIAAEDVPLGHENYYLNFLNSFIKIHYEEEHDIQEVPYTEKTAKFFCELIVGVCTLNEKIKDLINPESILKIANSENFKLLKS